MLVRVLGKLTFTNAGQLSKAHIPKEVTPSGIVTVVVKKINKLVLLIKYAIGLLLFVYKNMQ